MGLSLSHKFTILLYPDMLTVRHVENQQKGGGRRGVVKGFSDASRARLFRSMHKLEFEKLTFVTLTYPKHWDRDGRKWKKNLTAWKRVIDKMFDKPAGIWRMEFQKRGAPHFHIMYIDAPYMPVKTLCNVWGDIVDSGDYNHYLNGVDVKSISGDTGRKRAMSYVAKYAAKRQEEDVDYGNIREGRQWGIWNWLEKDPIEIECDFRGTLDIIHHALDCRGDNRTWFPDDYTQCSIFGSSVGSDVFRRGILSGLLGPDEGTTSRKP